MRLAMLALALAILGMRSASANTLQFSAITDEGETVSFTLDTSIPNTYSTILYPDTLTRGVYLNAAHNLSFQGTEIATTDVTTGPGETGTGQPLTLMVVGPLFNSDLLTLSFIFLDPTLIDPLSSDPLAYERSFLPFQSVLFPTIPPPRTHVHPLLSLNVTVVPEPSFAIPAAVIILCTIAARRTGVREL